MILFGRVFYKETRQFKNQKTHVATRETKIKTEESKKKKFFSPLFQESDRHTESTRRQKEQDKKKQISDVI